MSHIKYRGKMVYRDGFNRPRQVLVFIKFGEQGTRLAAPAIPVRVPGEPSRVWTLWPETHEDKPPALPVVPVHRRNAFHEDYVHDWNIHNGMFRYYSRITDEPVWVLLEYDRKEAPHDESLDWTDLQGR